MMHKGLSLSQATSQRLWETTELSTIMILSLRLVFLMRMRSFQPISVLKLMMSM
jgi:hypothetical protein